jgi:hypothetical protein
MIGRLGADCGMLPASVTEAPAPPAPWSPWSDRPVAAGLVPSSAGADARRNCDAPPDSPASRLNSPILN